MNVEPSIDILQEKLFQQKIKTLGVDYIIWVSGQTDYADKVGAVSCALGLQGGGCYGYASQNDESKIQSEIWHVPRKKLLGYNTATAKENTSYLLLLFRSQSLLIHVKRAVKKYHTQLF